VGGSEVPRYHHRSGAGSVAWAVDLQSGSGGQGDSLGAGGAAGLTEREVEVLRLLAKGHTNTRIAQELGVSERTVGFHVSNILKKLEVTSRVEAAMCAKEQGIVPR